MAELNLYNNVIKEPLPYELEELKPHIYLENRQGRALELKNITNGDTSLGCVTSSETLTFYTHLYKTVPEGETTPRYQLQEFKLYPGVVNFPEFPGNLRIYGESTDILLFDEALFMETDKFNTYDLSTRIEFDDPYSSFIFEFDRIGTDFMAISELVLLGNRRTEENIRSVKFE